MGFTLLAPTAKVKSGTFKISCVTRRGGSWQLQITIPSAEFTRVFGAAEKLDVLQGDGPDAGKLLLRVNPDGLFKPAGLKNCFVMRLPSTEATPQIDLAFENPDRRANGKGELVIDLPEWAWQPGRWKEIQKARVIAGRQVAAGETLKRKETPDRPGAAK